MLKSRRVICLFAISVLAVFCSCSLLLAQELEVVGTYYLEDSDITRSICVEGNYAYLARNGGGLIIFDISDLSSPFIAGTYDTAGYTVHDVAVNKNKAYLAVCGIGIMILDISNPNLPFLLGNSEINHASHGIFIRGDLAYLAHCEYDLTIFNIANPGNPTMICWFPIPFHFSWDIKVLNSYAYLLDLNQGLTIIDISDPYDPFITGIWDNSDVVYRISIFNEMVYITTRSYKIYIVDVSDVYNPTYLAEYDLDSLWTSDVVAINNRAYIAGTEIVILDISNPANPTLLAESNYNVSFHSLFVRNDIIFIAGYHWFYIVRYSPSTGIETRAKLPNRIDTISSFPNPFNSSTAINFTINRPGELNLSIYNIQGQRVTELLGGFQEAGEHSITWDASDFPSGVYFARLEAGGMSKTAKMVLLK